MILLIHVIWRCKLNDALMFTYSRNNSLQLKDSLSLDVAAVLMLYGAKYIIQNNLSSDCVSGKRPLCSDYA
jgi:hypothetical protein